MGMVYYKYRTDFENLIVETGYTEMSLGFNERIVEYQEVSMTLPLYNYRFDGVTIIATNPKIISHYLTVQKLMQDLKYFDVDSGTTDYYLIYNYLRVDYPVSNKIAPVNLDYDIAGLYKKRYFVKGDLIKVEYYGKFDGISLYEDLVVKEERTYYRINHMLNRREMKISWYLNDGTVGTEKNTLKYYTMQEAIEAGVTRRNNIVSKLKIDCVGLLQIASGVTSIQAQSNGQLFLEMYYVEIAKFISGYEDLIKNALAVDTEFMWLDLTIPNSGGITVRQYLISELTIDYSINNINT